MKLTDKETATVLAALRIMEDHMTLGLGGYAELRELDHFEEHPPLKPDEIDDLCERLNCGEPKGTIDVGDYPRAREIVNSLEDDGDRIFMHRVANKAFDEADPPPGPEPQDPADAHTFQVQVKGCTRQQAERAMAERLGHCEEYGFPYTLDWR